MNSWAGDWGKKGYAWIPSEMIDWGEIAFPLRKQFDKFMQIYNNGDIKAVTTKFITAYRMPWEE